MITPFLLLRNEHYQEELWKRSFEFLKDHLSPETIEKYGPPPEPAGTNEAVATEKNGEEGADMHEEKREAANDTVTTAAEGTDVDGKQSNNQQM